MIYQANLNHIPVMLKETLQAITTSPAQMTEQIFVDATFGVGGHSQALLAAGVKHVYAFDRDPTAIQIGQALIQKHGTRLTLIQDCYSNMVERLGELNITSVDGVIMDIGVSSMQLDYAERGFSFMKQGPLDMRMDSKGPTAAEIINHISQSDLAQILKILGEERYAKKIAREIVKQRTVKPFIYTYDLVDLIKTVVPVQQNARIHPATRSFQALRLYINSELEELAIGLASAEKLLAHNGRLVVISFHSLEDRIVKSFLKIRAGLFGNHSRHIPKIPSNILPSFILGDLKPKRPTDREVNVNPRARSAKLRSAIRTSAPSIPLDMKQVHVPKVPEFIKQWDQELLL